MTRLCYSFKNKVVTRLLQCYDKVINSFVNNKVVAFCMGFNGTTQNMQYIKTHDSESRGQEEAGRTRRTSELFTRSTALKFVNALNKPP